MSFWIRRFEGGRPTVTLAHGGYLLALLPLIAIFVVFVALNPTFSVLFLVTGFLCFFVAKLSVIRTGVWLSFGSRGMSRRNAKLYRIGYALMGFGILLSVPALIAVLRPWR